MKKKPEECEACLEKAQRHIEWYEDEDMWLCDECNEELTNRKAYREDEYQDFLKYMDEEETYDE